MKHFRTVALLVMLSLGLAARSAYGVAVLTGTALMLSDGTNSITVDFAGGTTTVGSVTVNSITFTPLGKITFDGKIGSDWDINVTTGISNPASGGDAANPIMHLNTLDHSTGTGTKVLTIKFTDRNFTPVPDHFVFNIGSLINPGNPAATMKLETYADAGNVDFALTTLLDSHMMSSPGGAVIDAPNIALPPGAPYSLTQVVTITHTRSGSSSTDYELDGFAVPEPATLLLLGSGLAGFGYLRRRRQGA